MEVPKSNIKALFKITWKIVLKMFVRYRIEIHKVKKSINIKLKINNKLRKLR